MMCGMDFRNGFFAILLGTFDKLLCILRHFRELLKTLGSHFSIFVHFVLQLLSRLNVLGMRTH